MDALNTLIEAHTPRLYKVVQRIANDQDMAEEVVQETWIRAWKALKRVDPSRPFFPWLVSIALNLARDQWRRKIPLDFPPGADQLLMVSDPAPPPEVVLEEKEMHQRLAGEVAHLRPAYRAVIALRYDGGLSYAEIADTLDMPLNTVRTHLRRAKQDLRERMRDE